MVSGGNGRGTGVKGRGILLANGEPTSAKAGYHRDIKPNQFSHSKMPPGFVAGVFLPSGPGTISLPDNIVLGDIPKTSGHAWDVIRNGTLNSQVHSNAAGTNFATEGHSTLGLHANAGITFNLTAIRQAHHLKAMRLSGTVAFGAETSVKNSTADFTVYVDGAVKFRRLKMHKDATEFLDIPLPASAKHLTLMATDGGDGI
eukprot:gene14767-18043_t